MRPRLLDYIILSGTLFIIGIFSFNAYGKALTPEECIITSPKGTWVYPLSKDSTLAVVGTLGVMEIEIHDGKVRVVFSPCKEKICIQTGAISKTGTWIACVPNRVFLKIEGKGDDETDTDSF